MSLTLVVMGKFVISDCLITSSYSLEFCNIHVDTNNTLLTFGLRNAPETCMLIEVSALYL